MPRRPKSRLERLGDVAAYVRRAKEELQAIDVPEHPAGTRSGIEELRDDLDAFSGKVVKAIQTEARTSLSLDRAAAQD